MELIGKIVLIALILLAVVAVLRWVPDVRRYLRIRRM